MDIEGRQATRACRQALNQRRHYNPFASEIGKTCIRTPTKYYGFAATGKERLITSDTAKWQTKPFIPNLCTLQSVFLLVLLGELLAVCLSIAASGMQRLDWAELGLHSILIQWIVLLSAATLCPLRNWLANTNPLLAGFSCYSLVLSVTLFCQASGYWALHRQLPSMALLINTLTLAAILAGIVLRYLYIQQQLHNQQQAELEARIQALQSRIQPHFLFNSLNSIASLIAVRPEVAESMIEDLSDLFRASLKEPGLIPLAEEIELCRRYIAIEQRRLGEHLEVIWQLPQQELLNRAVIPSLLLQPLIENAVHHGIQSLAGGGTVSIHIQQLEDTLSITLTNPISASLQSSKGNQMALNNIKHRLHAHFGPTATLSTQNGPDEYRVNLRYPVTASENP